MKPDLMSLLLGSAAGIAIGYISFLLNSPLFSLALALAIAVVLFFVSKKFANGTSGKFGVKWWLVNGGLSYFLVWFIVWVLALNLVK